MIELNRVNFGLNVTRVPEEVNKNKIEFGITRNHFSALFIESACDSEVRGFDRCSSKKRKLGG